MSRGAEHMTGTQKQTVVIKAALHTEPICSLAHPETRAWLPLRPDHAPVALLPGLVHAAWGVGGCEVLRAAPTHGI